MEIINAGFFLEGGETYIPYREVQKVFVQRGDKTHRICLHLNGSDTEVIYRTYNSFDRCMQEFQMFVTRFDNYERR